jgi:hypothetical protein
VNCFTIGLKSALRPATQLLIRSDFGTRPAGVIVQFLVERVDVQEDALEARVRAKVACQPGRGTAATG